MNRMGMAHLQRSLPVLRLLEAVALFPDVPGRGEALWAGQALSAPCCTSRDTGPSPSPAGSEPLRSHSAPHPSHLPDPALLGVHSCTHSQCSSAGRSIQSTPPSPWLPVHWNHTPASQGLPYLQSPSTEASAPPHSESTTPVVPLGSLPDSRRWSLTSTHPTHPQASSLNKTQVCPPSPLSLYCLSLHAPLPPSPTLSGRPQYPQRTWRPQYPQRTMEQS